MKLILFLVLVISYNYVLSANIRVDPLVLIDQGLVRGSKATDGDYSEFLGIPYAKVDTNNPFGAALPAPNFDVEIFEANYGMTVCPQLQNAEFVTKAIKLDETIDCLKLNIYVPSSASSKNPLPVLIWIHGGRFEFGYAGEYNPREIVKNDVVVVTINYRLGAYGFMCLDSPTAPGNQGIKDQNVALKWVRNNIAAFGGNPYKITVGGQSAGACSTLLHLYSDKDKVYNQVIVQSGTPQNEGMFVEGDQDAAIKIAHHLGFNTTDTELALQFLARSSPDLVTGAAADLRLVLRPCREKSFSGVENFVETDPFSLANEEKVKNTPVLIGHTSLEFVNYLTKEYGDDYFTKDVFYEKLSNHFNLEESQLQAAAEIVKHFYIGDQPVSEDVVGQLEQFDSDFVFNHPMQRSITRLIEQNASPIYEYVFSYVGNSGLRGAAHSAELPFLFPNFFVEFPVIGNHDALVSERITSLWANFIKYGNPTPAVTDLLPISWTPVAEPIRSYMVIDSEITMEARVFNDRMAFWDLFISAYGSHNRLVRECPLDRIK